MSAPRVAVTGLGPVSALGTGIEAFWSALVRGDSGLRPLTRCRPMPLGCEVVAEVLDPAYQPMDAARPRSRTVDLTRVAAELAFRDAGLAYDSERIGVVVGTSLGNADVVESITGAVAQGRPVSAAAAFNTFAHASACEVARTLDLRGPVHTVTSGCNAGADALGLAFDWLRLGRVDAVVVGGSDNEISELFLRPMHACKALAVRHNGRPAAASRPFDKGRDGNVPGEGAGFLVLENLELARRRGARIRAELKSYVSRAVGAREYDPFHPVLDPLPLRRTIEQALQQAEIGADGISVVSANGSASVFYDPLEAEAIRASLTGAYPGIHVHSIKGGLGQTGACTSAFQAIAAAMTVERNQVPPTINVDRQDENCPIPLVTGRARECDVRHVLCNAIGFGGFYYSTLIFGKAG